MNPRNMVVLLGLLHGCTSEAEQPQGPPHNRIPIRVYEATMPRSPTTFRAIATLSDYYNYEYAHAQSTHYSIRLRDDSGRINGFILKSSPDSERLVQTLSDGMGHFVTVTLQYSADSHGADTATIVHVQREGNSN